MTDTPNDDGPGRNVVCPNCGRRVARIETAGPNTHTAGPCGCRVSCDHTADLPRADED